MKYFPPVVLRPVEIPPPKPREQRPRKQVYRAGKRFDREVVIDLRRFHPFAGRVPAHKQEVAEEIGARLTVLAVRTHVPLAGRPRPVVTLRMRHALRLLARWGGQLTVGQLATQIGVGDAAASQLTTRMLRRGLVTKERPPDVGRHDRRVRRVAITAHGWKHVPRDEPAVRETYRIGGDDDLWGGTWVRKWPQGLRRRTQEPAPVEEGLACTALEPRALLAGLRAVQATMCGYDIDRWGNYFLGAVAARRRIRRARYDERYQIADLPLPRYIMIPRRR